MQLILITNPILSNRESGNSTKRSGSTSRRDIRGLLKGRKTMPITVNNFDDAVPQLAVSKEIAKLKLARRGSHARPISNL